MAYFLVSAKRDPKSFIQASGKKNETSHIHLMTYLVAEVEVQSHSSLIHENDTFQVNMLENIVSGVYIFELSWNDFKP